MNSWITNWNKIKIKVKQIIKKQPYGQQETDWKSCPQCKKISYFPDMAANLYICECSYHFDCPPKFRLDNLFDSTYEIIGNGVKNKISGLDLAINVGQYLKELREGLSKK